MNREIYKELSEWVEKAKNGDEGAFQYIYNNTYKKVRFLVYNFHDDKDEVEDIVQEVYINVFNSINQLNNNDFFIQWINQITYRCCLNTIRKKNNTVLVEREDNQYDRLFSEKDKEPLKKILNEEKNKLLLDCINKLPPKQRDTLILRVYSELKYEEIANTMGCSKDNVKKNLQKAKKNLKMLIEELPEGQKNVLVTRSVGTFTFYQMIRKILIDMTDEGSRRALGTIQIVAIGVGVAAVCGSGIWLGMNYNNLFTGHLPNLVIETSQTETNSVVEVLDVSEADVDLVENTEVALEAIPDTEEEKNEPEILSWGVNSGNLLVYLQDAEEIAFDKVYGVSKKGIRIYPESYDKVKGILYFDAYEKDFTLYVINMKGEVSAWDMIRVD